MTTSSCVPIDSCIACDSSNLIQVLDLKEQPLANSFKKTQNEQEAYYPLILNRCVSCNHLQLSHMVNPDELFKNYLYVSGTSNTQLAYFDWFSKMVKHRLGVEHANVLDIGCNDGSQLDYFKSIGFSTYGVDPAENLHPISSKRHNVVCDYFNLDHVEFPVKFDSIVCQNAFSHNYNQHQFLQKCKTLMSENGLLFITTSQADMIKHGEFDTIYHEHYSYYSVHSMKVLCERSGMCLVDVLVHPIHGNSYIFVISPNNRQSDSVDLAIQQEKNDGLYGDEIYSKYAKAAIQTSVDTKAKIDSIRKDGYKIIGYGSPAKGNTFLNFSGCKLDFIIDDNPMKQGMFTPGSSIPIHSIEHLNNYRDSLICFVPLAWNFFDEIVGRIKKVRPNSSDLYLKYFPSVIVKENL